MFLKVKQKQFLPCCFSLLESSVAALKLIKIVWNMKIKKHVLSTARLISCISNVIVCLMKSDAQSFCLRCVLRAGYRIDLTWHLAAIIFNENKSPKKILRSESSCYNCGEPILGWWEVRRRGRCGCGQTSQGGVVSSWWETGGVTTWSPPLLTSFSSSS